MTNKKRKERSREILEDLSTSIKKSSLPLDDKGNLDILEYNKLPKVREAIVKLKGINIDKRWLIENGFMPAAMILMFSDENKSKQDKKPSDDLLF